MSATPQEEIADAEALYAALEERIKAGDESVTPEELDRARGLSRFAQLRAEAAARREREERKAEAAAEVAAAADAAEEFLASLSSLDDDIAALRSAFAMLIAASDERRERGRRVMGRLEAANLRAEELGVATSFAEGRDARIRASASSAAMARGGERTMWANTDLSAHDLIQATIAGTDVVVDGVRRHTGV